VAWRIPFRLALRIDPRRFWQSWQFYKFPGAAPADATALYAIGPVKIYLPKISPLCCHRFGADPDRVGFLPFPRK
jgi:hypothetical protein